MDPFDPGQEGFSNLTDAVQDMSLFADCSSTEQVRAALREQIEVEVQAMAALVAEADAFDVLELMRLRELSMIPDPRALIPDSSALAIEIVAAMLLSRPSRRPSGGAHEGSRPHQHIDELHRRAQRITRLATIRHLVEAHLSDDPLAMMAAQYRSAVMGIRNLQYRTIRDSHEAQLFDNDRVAPLMRKHLGYTYPDVVAVRSAMALVGSQRMTQLRDGTTEVMLRNQGVPPDQVPAEDVEEFLSQMIPMMFLPGDRATITVRDIAATGAVEAEVASTVLASYAQTFDSSVSATDRVYGMLVGSNPFLVTPLVSDGEGNFVATSNEIGLDSLRRILEKALTSNPQDFTAYDKKARQVMSERIALEALRTILNVSPAHEGFTYYAPKNVDQIALLDQNCSNFNEVGKQVEGDGLFVVDDVAFVQETKGKSMADQARRGDVTRLSRDLKATIGDACDQARRLQALIEINHGIWLSDQTWLDLSHIREVRSVTALLDDVGPLGTAIGELQRVGIVSDARPPWVASLHDLTTIAAVTDRPAEFLLYLRLRTDSPATQHFWALDELDLFMLFLQGDLYVDPEEATAAIAMVDDHCGELNAWMDREQFDGHDLPAAKPSFNAVPAMLGLIDRITELGQRGWLRCGADLLALSGETQQQVLDAISELTNRASADSNYHDGVLSWDTPWGRPILFLAARPEGIDLTPATQRLLGYMRAKSAQVGADRGYGLLVDTQGNLERFLSI